MPFDAMKGLQEALRDREERHSRVEKHDISEEQIEKNSRLLERLERGMRIRLECHHSFHDVCMEGRVTEISCSFRYLRLDESRQDRRRAQRFPARAGKAAQRPSVQIDDIRILGKGDDEIRHC